MEYGMIAGIQKPVSKLVQGTVMAGTHDLDYSFGLLDAVFHLGCNTFDTAHIYGGGDNERTVGQWVAERGIRDRVVLIGKGAHHNADRNRVTPFDITSDLMDTLARFKTDYVDLYLLHRDDPSVPVGPIVEVLNDHKSAGHIHAFGGSNWTTERLQEANDYARERGLVPFAASSPHFSLAVQLKEPWPGCVTITGRAHTKDREWYQQTQMPLIPWSSGAAGFFSGRLSRENADNPDGSVELAKHCYASEENFTRLDRAAELGEEKGVTANQIAAAWVLKQPYNVFAMMGPRTPEEFQQNLEALQVDLSDAEIAWLNLETDSR